MAQIPNEQRQWHIIDANEAILGRTATKIADILRGKKKTSFVSHLDCGDYVVVINAEKVKLTGKKEEQKRYYKHTGYIGNLKTMTVPELREKNPKKILYNAVYGMLPKNKLRDGFLGRLKIYSGSKHPHQNVKFINS
jgi:large subunit ribosomal protein L13